MGLKIDSKFASTPDRRPAQQQGVVKQQSAVHVQRHGGKVSEGQGASQMDFGAMVSAASLWATAFKSERIRLLQFVCLIYY